MRDNDRSPLTTRTFRETARGRHAGISAAGKEASCRLGTILLAQDIHTRPEGLTNLMAKAEMELRRQRLNAAPLAIRTMRTIQILMRIRAALPPRCPRIVLRRTEIIYFRRLASPGVPAHRCEVRRAGDLSSAPSWSAGLPLIIIISAAICPSVNPSVNACNARRS